MIMNCVILFVVCLLGVHNPCLFEGRLDRGQQCLFKMISKIKHCLSLIPLVSTYSVTFILTYCLLSGFFFVFVFTFVQLLITFITSGPFIPPSGF